jgi:hypothetical protein
MLVEEVQKLIDSGVSGTDILHGYIKNMMYETDLELAPLQANSEELGSDEEYEDTVERLYNEGYMDALMTVNQFVIDLTYAIEERNIKNATV